MIAVKVCRCRDVSDDSGRAFQPACQLYAYGRGRIFLTPSLADPRGWEFYAPENGVRRDLSIDEIREMEPGAGAAV